jgi:mitotic spindle assembly checkpoint protein MAD2
LSGGSLTYVLPLVPRPASTPHPATPSTPHPPSSVANPPGKPQVQIFAKPKSSKSKSSKTAQPQPPPTTNTDENNTPSTTSPAAAAAAEAKTAPEKTEAEIQSEIAAIFRQITASVTFLPQLQGGDCTFNVLVYADASSDVPVEWGDSDAKEIVNGERVQLRGFSTQSHRVDTLVSYRLAD